MKQNILRNWTKFGMMGNINLEMVISLRRFFYPALMKCEDLIAKKSVTKHLFRLRKLKYTDPEKLHDYQLKALQKLLVYAYQNVPFYKERFNTQGIHPEDVKTFEDFAKIQPLSRENVIENYEALKSRARDKNSLLVGKTSGSSGTPMLFYYDNEACSAGRAAVLAGWELAGKRLGDKLTTVWGNRITVEEKWTKRGSRLKAKLNRNLRIGSYLLWDESQIRHALDLMRNRRGGYMHGYTNSIYTLACYANEHKIRLEPKFDGILTTAENLFPFQKSIIEEVFGPVYDGYGSAEILGIAFQCQERNGYHVVEPNVIFETDQHADKTKEIIVTDLWNYAWPLIRYKPCDLVSGEMVRGCACGCTWSTFAKIDGRASDILTATDGTGIHFIIWEAFALLLSNHPYVKQFQWRKVANDKLVLRLLLQNEPSKAIKDKMTADLAPYFEGLIELSVEFVDKFEAGPSGKHKVIVDETRQASPSTCPSS